VVWVSGGDLWYDFAEGDMTGNELKKLIAQGETLTVYLTKSLLEEAEDAK